MANQQMVADVKRAYVISDQEEVLQILGEQPNLLALLQDAPGVIARYFEAPRLSLFVFHDPEEDLEQSELTIRIGTTLPAREAIRQLGRLHDEWLVPAVMSGTAKRLIVGVEPVND